MEKWDTLNFGLWVQTIEICRCFRFLLTILIQSIKNLRHYVLLLLLLFLTILLKTCWLRSGRSFLSILVNNFLHLPEILFTIIKVFPFEMIKMRDLIIIIKLFQLEIEIIHFVKIWFNYLCILGCPDSLGITTSLTNWGHSAQLDLGLWTTHCGGGCHWASNPHTHRHRHMCRCGVRNWGRPWRGYSDRCTSHQSLWGLHSNVLWLESLVLLLHAPLIIHHLRIVAPICRVGGICLVLKHWRCSLQSTLGLGSLQIGNILRTLDQNLSVHTRSCKTYWLGVHHSGNNHRLLNSDNLIMWSHNNSWILLLCWHRNRNPTAHFQRFWGRWWSLDRHLGGDVRGWGQETGGWLWQLVVRTSHCFLDCWLSLFFSWRTALVQFSCFPFAFIRCRKTISHVQSI